MGTKPKIHPWEGFSVLGLLFIYRWRLTCHFNNVMALNKERVQKFKFILPRVCKTTTSSLSLNKHKDVVTENQHYITEGIPWNSSQRFAVLPASGNQSSRLAQFPWQCLVRDFRKESSKGTSWARSHVRLVYSKCLGDGFALQLEYVNTTQMELQHK